MDSSYEAFYRENGYCVINVFSDLEHQNIINFAKKWVETTIKNNAKSSFDKVNFDKLNIEHYHKWHKEFSYDHDGVFIANRRYIDPPEEIRKILINSKLKKKLTNLGINYFELWKDPGLEWLGYRIIRPGMEDGYPASCKNWGAAAGVISIWVPVCGFTSSETIALLPGSHKKIFKKHLPINSKFTSGEFRLNENIDESLFIRPKLSIGNVIVFHPNTIHTEDVYKSQITRLNLEFRFKH